MRFAARTKRDFYADGLAAAGEGQHLDAIAHFQRALQKNPGDSRALLALGNIAMAVGHAAVAENSFLRALEQEPDQRDVRVNYANLLRSQGRTDEAIALIKPALERNPKDIELWLTQGATTRQAGDRKMAEIFYSEALRLSPGHAMALRNLGELLLERGARDEVRALCEEVLAREPEHPQARFNRAILFLLKGNLDQGWHDYEYRLHIKEQAIVADHGLTQWNGTRKEGLRLLVTTEQGIAEQMMFASLIPELAALLARNACRVILEAESRLVPLFARSFPGVCVRPAALQSQDGQLFAHYDWLKSCGGADAAIAIGSLAHRMRQALSDFPGRPSYLIADASEKAAWLEWLRAQGEGPFAGLCWRSGKAAGTRSPHHAPLEVWANFIRDLPATPVSLQQDASAEEIATLERLSGRSILVPPNLDQTSEIDRTAALIAALDAVVSAPTSVSWIAAGLGVPTVKILSHPSWTTFGCDYEPFAPAARSIMRTQTGDWADAFGMAREALGSILPAV
ncbi:MAG TPA: tetratricopeptide repeat protein [Micropepsaceae bacterium]|nr:tetratricopeptide repeat protein [Micropepsaceae bacterium]